MSWLKQAMNREMTRRNKLGAYLAMLTCPCHVVMLLFLTAGTAVGTWLGRYNSLLYIVAAVLFAIGVWTMFHPGKSCPVPKNSKPHQP
jgi:mercuric ion transport protein